MIARRAFLTGLVSLMAAPAVVKAASLMPIRGIIMPPHWMTVTLQGIQTVEFPPIEGQMCQTITYSGGPLWQQLVHTRATS
jgi:hypothetical protein